MVKYIVVPTNIVAGDILCWYSTRGTFCHPKAYIVTRMKFLPCTYCRLRQYVPKCAAYIVAPLCKKFKQDNWVHYKYILRERSEIKIERGYLIIFIKFKILKFHVCVYPNVDGPSGYEIDGGLSKRVLLLV